MKGGEENEDSGQKHNP